MLDVWEKEDYQETEDLKDLKEQLELLELKEPKDLLDPLENKESQDLKDPWEKSMLASKLTQFNAMLSLLQVVLILHWLHGALPPQS